MFDILCFTNRKLCREDFLLRIKKIAQAHPNGIILREKDLMEPEYMSLAKDVIEICEKYNATCILHNFVGVAKELNCKALHLPLNIFLTLSDEDKKDFSILGVSCHSAEDAIMAEKLGATYITAGHIFETDCKKGIKGRGLEFLQNVCKSVQIPVYAIGGITAQNIGEVKKSGACGVCVMSSMMKCENVEKYLGELK